MGVHRRRLADAREHPGRGAPGQRTRHGQRLLRRRRARGGGLPEGRLQIQVSSEDRAYIQNLTCTGDAVADPALCRELASIAAEQEEEAEEQETGVGLFDEVPEEAVCDADRAYGPGEARITGEWEGEEVDTALNRADSCEEVRWQRLLPLLEPME
ncbi:hypothetical protein ACFQXA_32080 [Nocardiopsis composta]